MRYSLTDMTSIGYNKITPPPPTTAAALCGRKTMALVGQVFETALSVGAVILVFYTLILLSLTSSLSECTDTCTTSTRLMPRIIQYHMAPHLPPACEFVCQVGDLVRRTLYELADIPIPPSPAEVLARAKAKEAARKRRFFHL